MVQYQSVNGQFPLSHQLNTSTRIPYIFFFMQIFFFFFMQLSFNSTGNGKTVAYISMAKKISRSLLVAVFSI